MKLYINKENILYIIYTLVFVLLCTAAVIVSFYTIPSAISYHPVYDSKEASAVTVEKKISSGQDISLYDSLYDIQQDGPFLIKTENESIYVFSEALRLYRIAANADMLPEAVRKAIILGIEAETRERLFEIVEYMES